MKAHKIYSSWNMGEWGGRIVQIDSTTGSLPDASSNDSMKPVTDLKFGTDGKLWFVTGMDHLMLQGAALFSYDGKLNWISEIFGARSSIQKAFPTATGNPVIKRRNWTLEPTTFVGLTLCADGSLLIASKDYGLMKYSNEHWNILTQTWPEGIPVCDLQLTESGIAVMPVLGLGIVLYDLKHRTIKFILKQ